MRGNFIHQELAQGRWFTLPFLEQMGNIGSEVGRAANAQGKDETRFRGAVERALELFDLTLADARWIKRKRLKEIARARELFCNAVYGNTEYNTSLQDLDRYFMQFAFAARKNI
jgi:hypothetical protein